MGRRSYKRFFVLLTVIQKAGIEVSRYDIVSEFTEGRTKSLSELSDREYQELLLWMNQYHPQQEKKEDWKKSPENIMRQKVYCLFVKNMGYTPAEMNHWMKTFSPQKKSLNEYKQRAELVKLVSVAERVFDNYQKQQYGS